MQIAALSQDCAVRQPRERSSTGRVGQSGPPAPSPLLVPLVHPSGPLQSPLAPFGGAACCARGPRAGHQCWGAACSQAPPADLGSSAPEARTPPAGCSRAEAGRRSCRRPRQLRGTREQHRYHGLGGSQQQREGACGALSPSRLARLLELGREAHGVSLRFLLPSMSLLPEDCLEQPCASGPLFCCPSVPSACATDGRPRQHGEVPASTEGSDSGAGGCPLQKNQPPGLTPGRLGLLLTHPAFLPPAATK